MRDGRQNPTFFPAGALREAFDVATVSIEPNEFPFNYFCVVSPLTRSVNFLDLYKFVIEQEHLMMVVLLSVGL